MNKNNNSKPMVLHKHNLMVKAKYNLTTIETKLYLNILYFLQSKLNDSSHKLIDLNTNVITLDMYKTSFKKLIPGNQYLEDAKFLRMFEGLRTKPIYYKIDKKWTLSGFIDRATINEEDPNMIRIELDKFTAKMLTEYKDNGYTPLNLALMFGLEGMYSYRLYELIRLWSNTKEVINYTVEELKEYLMLEDKKSYNTYANFKNKVIKPAVDELNELGLFKIQIEEKKVGRKVDSIDFIVKDMDKRKYFEKNAIKEVLEFKTEEKSEEKIVNHDNNVQVKEKKQEKEVMNSENKSFYIPDETIFTIGTLRAFKNDFSNYDFSIKHYESAFEDAVMITLDRDDIEQIKASSYKFFKGTLNNKIIEHEKEYEEELKHQKELDMFW